MKSRWSCVEQCFLGWVEFSQEQKVSSSWVSPLRNVGDSDVGDIIMLVT